MVTYPLDPADISILVSRLVREVVKKTEKQAFRKLCSSTYHLPGLYPLRYPDAFFRQWDSDNRDHSNPQFNDPDALFGFETVLQDGKWSMDKSIALVDVFGYDEGDVIINNLRIWDVDYFGLNEDDPLAKIVSNLNIEEERLWREKLEEHRDQIRHLSITYGRHHPTYKRLIKGEPELKKTREKIARSLTTMVSKELGGLEDKLTLVTLDLENRYTKFALDWGIGGSDGDTSYFAFLEFTDNCMRLSGYCKEKGAHRRLHPIKIEEFFVASDIAENVLFRLIDMSHKSRRYFKTISHDLQAQYPQFT